MIGSTIQGKKEGSFMPSVHILILFIVSLKDSKDASSLNVGASSEVPRLELSVKEVLGHGQGDQTPSFRKEFLPKGKADICCNRAQDTVKSVSVLAEPTSNLSMVHPMRLPDEESLGYDSGHDNGSARSFEFHKGERPLQQASSPFVRNLPSKWNDAERWIVHRQITHVKSNVSKKTAALNLGSLQVISNRVVFVPESASADHRHSLMQEPDAKTSSSTKSTSQNVAEKFSFAPNSSQSSLDSTSGLTDLSSVNSTYGGCFKKELNHAVSEKSTAKATGKPMFLHTLIINAYRICFELNYIYNHEAQTLRNAYHVLAMFFLLILLKDFDHL